MGSDDDDGVLTEILVSRLQTREERETQEEDAVLFDKADADDTRYDKTRPAPNTERGTEYATEQSRRKEQQTDIDIPLIPNSNNNHALRSRNASKTTKNNQPKPRSPQNIHQKSKVHQPQQHPLN